MFLGCFPAAPTLARRTRTTPRADPSFLLHSRLERPTGHRSTRTTRPSGAFPKRARAFQEPRGLAERRVVQATGRGSNGSRGPYVPLTALPWSESWRHERSMDPLLSGPWQSERPIIAGALRTNVASCLSGKNKSRWTPCPPKCSPGASRCSSSSPPAPRPSCSACACSARWPSRSVAGASSSTRRPSVTCTRTHRRVSSTPIKPRRATWAELLKRVFEIDVLTCPWCGGQRRLIALITDGAVVRKILDCLGLPTAAPALAPARSPPELDFAG
jgi:hypothetical protein